MTAARRLGVATVALAVLGLAVLGLVRAGQPADRSPRAQADAVAATLRCPTCNGLSVKDSSSPLAEGARTTIEQQLAQGRSPEEIRQWFVDRYGPSVLLAPAPSGPGLLAWVLPGVAVVAAAGFAWRWLHRERRAAAEPDDPSAATVLRIVGEGGLEPDASPSGEALRAALLARRALDDDRAAGARVDAEQVRRADERLAAAYRRHTTPPPARRPGGGRAGVPRRPVFLGSAAALLLVTGAGVVLAVHERGAEEPLTGGTAGSPAAASAPAGGSAATTAPGPVTPPPGWTGGMPRTAAEWVALGRAYDRAAQLQQAAAAYSMALRLQPGDDGVSLLRDDVLVRSGGAADALPDLQQLAGRHPDSPDVLLILGLAQHQSRAPDAESTLRRFLQLAPDSPAAPGVRNLLGPG